MMGDSLLDGSGSQYAHVDSAKLALAQTSAWRLVSHSRSAQAARGRSSLAHRPVFGGFY